MIEHSMLVAVSDLHLTDGTATNNLSPRAFKHFFEFIKRVYVKIQRRSLLSLQEIHLTY